MENTTAFFGALFLIGVVFGVNALMYGLVRGMIRTKKKSFLETLGDSFNPPNQKRKDSMGELRQKIAELNGEKKEPPSAPQ
jgi:hypothetical protein